MGVKTVCIRFSKIFLVVTNVFVVLLGILALVIGIWGVASDYDYTSIAEDDSSDFDSVPILLIVIGVVIVLVGLTGCVGAVMGSKKSGKVLLIAYAILLTIILLACIGGGIAAYVERDDIESRFRENTNSTFLDLNNTNSSRYLDDWNDVQDTVECCGLTHWRDWLMIQWNVNETEVVPASCCAGNCDSNVTFYYEDDIQDLTINRTEGVVVWQEGCTQAIIDRAEDALGVAGGVAIAVGVILVLAVIMAIFIAVAKGDFDSYEVV